MYLHRSPEAGTAPAIKRGYDKKFKVETRTRASLPDNVNLPRSSLARTCRSASGHPNFQVAGSSFSYEGGKILTLEPVFTGNRCPLEAELRHQHEPLNALFLENQSGVTNRRRWENSQSYLSTSKAGTRAELNFSYPMLRPSLRAGSRAIPFDNVAFGWRHEVRWPLPGASSISISFIPPAARAADFPNIRATNAAAYTRSRNRTQQGCASTLEEVEGKKI